MIRARFKTNQDDPRPVNWPIKHPYWVTGYGALWPLAPLSVYLNRDLYPMPDWIFTAESQGEPQ